MDWCENNRVDYVFGLAKNKRLLKILGRELHVAQEEFTATGQPARQFKDFVYRTRQSWSRERRVVGKAESRRAGSQGEQPAVRRHDALRREIRGPRLV